MLALETHNLTKIFHGYHAVDGLDLMVPEGTIYGFLGPNGAGKTTTIKMITGLSRPSAGEIKICGREVKFGSLINTKDVGFLPDVPNFYDWMTAREFLKFTGEVFGISEKELKKRVNELLELVGLDGAKNVIKGFSRGMKQRLGIAQALINEPRIVFLDEPTSALDPIGRKEVLDIITKLSGKVTVFFSTHILADVERICDRVIILNKGKMVVEDTIANLRDQYSYHCITLDLGNDEDENNFINLLKQQKWVNDVVKQENSIKVFVGNMQEAQTKIPGMLYEKNIPLRRFNILEPTLEDIFFKVVSKV